MQFLKQTSCTGSTLIAKLKKNHYWPGAPNGPNSKIYFLECIGYIPTVYKTGAQVVFDLQPVEMPANPEIRVEFKRPEIPPPLNKKRRGPKPGSKRKKDSELHKCTNNCDYFGRGKIQNVNQHRHYNSIYSFCCYICRKHLRTKQALTNHIHSHLGKEKYTRVSIILIMQWYI